MKLYRTVPMYPRTYLCILIEAGISINSTNRDSKKTAYRFLPIKPRTIFWIFKILWGTKTKKRRKVNREKLEANIWVVLKRISVIEFLLTRNKCKVVDWDAMQFKRKQIQIKSNAFYDYYISYEFRDWAIAVVKSKNIGILW